MGQMEGAVHAINPELALIAVDTPGGYTVFEQTGADFEEGDFVSWSPDRPLGAAEVRNVSKGRASRVYFLNHGVPGTFLKLNLQL